MFVSFIWFTMNEIHMDEFKQGLHIERPHIVTLPMYNSRAYVVMAFRFNSSLVSALCTPPYYTFNLLLVVYIIF